MATGLIILATLKPRRSEMNAMDELDPCEVCGLAKQRHALDTDVNLNTVTCQNCGKFVWGADAGRPDLPGHRVRLSGYIHELNRGGAVPTLNAQLLAAIGRMPIPRLPERAMKLLLEVANVAENPEGWYLPDGQPRYLAASYSTDYRELKILLRILEDKGLLEFGPSRAIRLTASGFIAAEASKYLASPSANGFVAMSFANEMTDAYVNGFDPGVRAAGYQPVRIDQKEHANPISDEIMAEIRRARFVVADYTMSNNGVYFEAGFATGLGILVIPTCRRSEISGLHFDIRHINTLTWETPVELASALPKRISAIIGDGPLRRPTAEK